MTEIVRAGPEVVDELRPLWLAMVHHHGRALLQRTGEELARS